MLPVVLLHAFPLDSRMYAPLRAYLGRKVELLTPDFPGFGGRVRPGQEPSLDVYADDLLAWLDDRGLTRVVLGGTSMGGYVTMAALRRRPAIASAVVLLDTRASADAPEGAQGRLEMADRLDAEQTPQALVEGMLPRLLGITSAQQRPETVAQVRAWVEAADPSAAAWAQRAMAARAESFTTLASCGLPGLVLVGDEDELTPPSDAAAMVDVWPGASLVTVERAGHLAALERPDAVAEVIARFVATLD